MKTFIIGITGASGSGKTSFLKQLMGSFEKNDICLISQDNYYKAFQEQKKDEKGIVNFDLPHAIDAERYARDIVEIAKGRQVLIQEYTFNNPHKESQTITFEPAPIILVEGLFIFHYEALQDLFDLKVFIDIEEHIGLKRRILRDNIERNLDLDDVLYRYEHHVSPAYRKYVLPHKYDSDLIIPNNINFQKGLDVLVAFLKSKL